jgi:catechol 2,3-dioxygenase-like lactoylglutathione lyase family enzyme
MTEQHRDIQDVSVVQIGLNTNNLSGSLYLYAEVFGFANAGSNAIWGDTMLIQALSPADHAVVWWMIGDAPFFQLELFYHGSPKQRLQPADWRPSDHGWVRFGIAVDDFDRVVKGLGRWNIMPLGTAGIRSERRLAFRDPHIGCIVEVIERAAPGLPTVIYATRSVADINEARHFYQEVIGAPLEPLEILHQPADEALWGLVGAQRDGFLARFGTRVIEIVRYSDPEGRPNPADRLTSDQGIVNLALGSRNAKVIGDLIERIRDDGHPPTIVFGDGGDMIGTYFADAGCELEVFASSPQNDAAGGFTRAAPFLAHSGISSNHG